MFVCESRYHSRTRAFKKIKLWNTARNASVRVVGREVALEPVRVASVFVDKTEVPDSESEESSVLDRDREVCTEVCDWTGTGSYVLR